eukprot:gene24325-29404_t
MFDFSGYKGEQAFVDAEEAAEKSVVLKPATSPSLPDAHAGKQIPRLRSDLLLKSL